MIEYAILAATSFGLGAIHALEPGHGKTVVAAYLVGSRGTSWDAVLLGVVVTATHTGGVIALGVLSTVAAAYFVPETVQKALEVVSGLLIVGVGAWMIGVRVRQARSHQRGPGHAHSHDDAHDHGDPLGGGHEHGHGHEDNGEKRDDGDAGGAHTHLHAPQLAPGEKATAWQLVALGISGGIVPCPAALAVLLAAISFGNFLRGVSLVVVFSMGMAAMLVAIGIAMVRAAKFAATYVAESRWTKIQPIVSATIITLVGLGLTVKAVYDLI